MSAEVAAADEPLVVLLDHEAGREPDQRGVVGEDADDVGAAADLAVDPLERVGGAQLAPVVGGEGVEGEQVLLGSSSIAATFGSGLRSRSSASPTSARACSPDSALKIGRISAASIPCCSLRACPSASRRKWTLQRCQGQPSTWRDRLLQAVVRVGDDELDAGQAALDQCAEEAAPERLRLRLAAVERDHLAGSRTRARRRRSRGLAHDAAAVSDLLHLGVEPEVRVAALERPVAEGVDLLVEPLADAGDLAL